MTDIALLAQDAVSVVAPVLPILLEEGREVADELSAEYVPAMRAKAKLIWEKLHPHLAKRPGAGEAIDKLAATPQDKDAQTAVCHHVKSLLSEDSKLADEIEKLTQDKP